MSQARHTARKIVAEKIAASRPYIVSYKARQAQARISQAQATIPNSIYQRNPEGYARDVLGVDWTPAQKQIARALVEHPKVFVMASHNQGKTHFAGGIVNWHFDCFNPSITKTTAPTQHQVNRLTWKEVRTQRGGRGMAPKAPTIEDYLPTGEVNPNHYAGGYTAKNADSFQGDHEENLLIVFEEAVGIHEQFWTAADGMLSSGGGNRWLAIMNPTDTASYAYQEYLSGDWHIIQISAFDHPNIKAQLEGLPRPYPKAISLDWIEKRIKQWCRPVGDSDKKKPQDFCWPPIAHCLKYGIEPQWFRPDSRFEGRVLGRWPSSGTNGIWSEALADMAFMPKPHLQRESRLYPIQIGCDVARRGEDNTSIHVRRGPVSLYHETYNGNDTVYTQERLMLLANEWAHFAGMSPFEVPLCIDDDGVGGGVVDNLKAAGYWAIGIGAGTVALDRERYRLRRSELWFDVADRAGDERIDLSLLDTESRDNLRRQLMAPQWKMRSGKREVEDKDETKKRIKRSPDDADAFNLAYAGFIEGPPAALGGNRDEQFRQ